MSRLLKLRAVTTALLLTSLALGVSAQTITAGATLFNFQGRLANPSGNPVPNGTYSVTLSLWDAASGGNKRWEQTFANITVSNGTFAALLNLASGFTAGNTLDTAINGSSFLEIKIGSDVALAPRQQLVSVPYALKANTVPDASITGAKIANGAITADKLASGVLTGLAGGDLIGNYPNPQLRTGADLLYKVSGTMLTAIGSGLVVDAQQNVAPLVGVDYAWQSFTASATGLVLSIDIWCGTSTGSNKGATLQIFDGEGIAGTLLRTYAVIITPTSRFQTFTVNVPVSAGQKYTWQLGTSASTRYGYSPGNLYSGGKSDLGDTLDYAFRTSLQGATSPQVTSAANLLINSTFLGIANSGYLELGYGIAGKEVNAGKIGYAIFTPTTLDIVGAGTTGTNRKVKFYAEGGATFDGNLNVNTSNALSLALTGNGEVGNNTGIGHPADGVITFRNNGTEQLRVTSAGSVGIGTANPLSRLHVNGDLTFENSNVIYAKDSGGNSQAVFFPRWNNDQTYLNYGAGGFNIRNNASNLTMFMTNGGNVGIGSNNPNAKLVVAGTGRVLAVSDGTRSGVSYLGDLGTNFNGYFFGTDSNHPLYLQADNNVSATLMPNGSFGLGTTTPKQRLHNTGDYYGRGHIWLHANEGDGASGTAYIQARDDSAGSSVGMRIRTKSGSTIVDAIYISPDGRVGINSGVSNSGLQVDANGQTYAIGSFGRFIASGYSTQSDERLKTRIASLPNALEAILGLRGVSYEWRPDVPQYSQGKAGKEVGFLAQEVEKILPEIVMPGLNGFKAVNYQGVIPYLVEAMKIQQKQLTAKEERLSAVEAENANLKAQMQNILERLQQLEQNRQPQK